MTCIGVSVYQRPRWLTFTPGASQTSLFPSYSAVSFIAGSHRVAQLVCPRSERAAGFWKLVSDPGTKAVAEVRRVDKGTQYIVTSPIGLASLKPTRRGSRLYRHSSQPTPLVGSIAAANDLLDDRGTPPWSPLPLPGGSARDAGNIYSDRSVSVMAGEMCAFHSHYPSSKPNSR